MKLSQTQTILKCLKRKRTVSLPELMDLRSNGRRIANITARISQLRDRGYDIRNTLGHDKKGYVTSKYSLWA